jgi:hypothetical protein
LTITCGRQGGVMEEIKSVVPKQDQKGMRSNFSMLVLLCISLSMGSGILSGWWFGRNSQGRREVVVLDVGSIVEAKKKEFIEKYREKEATPALKTKMQKEISIFTERLNRIIEGESKNRIIFVKDLVLSEERDITDEVAKKVNESR